LDNLDIVFQIINQFAIIVFVLFWDISSDE